MKKKFMRNLDNNDLMNEFLVHALDYEECEKTSEIVTKLVGAEMRLSRLGDESTYDSTSFRSPSYKTEAERKKLRKEIFEDLISNARLPNDDKITLGNGGALPNGSSPRKGKHAFLIIGPPASGKSSIACEIADVKKAIILDCDYAKRKFPEYNQDFGASLVHKESDMVVFNAPDKFSFSVFQYCVAAGYNIIIPKIGTDKIEIEKLRDDLINYGYSVHLILVSLDRVKATQRAVSRFVTTNRYVPLSLIFDQYSNEAILAYYRTKKNVKWTSTGKLSTDTPKGAKPIVVEFENNSPVKIFK